MVTGTGTQIMLFRDGKRMVRVFWKRGNTGTLWERLV